MTPNLLGTAIPTDLRLSLRVPLGCLPQWCLADTTTARIVVYGALLRFVRLRNASLCEAQGMGTCVRRCTAAER